MYQEFNNMNYYYLPKLSNLNVVYYDNYLLAIGGNNDKLYSSSDCGITLKKTESFTLPEGFSANEVSLAVDADNFIWIVCTDISIS